MAVKIHPSWEKVLAPQFEQEYFKKLISYIRAEYKKEQVYPPGSQIFNAFELTPFDQVKVVIIGQDPYHGEGQAHGLSFSVPEGVKPPPSLMNIYKEIEADLGKEIPKSGNLERWAKQGVLLLNATLTVRAKSPGSHQNQGWEQFTDAAIESLNEQRENLVYMLWGSYAQRKGEFIDRDQNLVLEAAHPSPFSAHNGFFGCRHFSKANKFLILNDTEPIDW